MIIKRDQPVIVMPVAYWLPFNMWRWCKLGDVCETAVRVAELAGNTYHPNPEQLVREFAALVRPNRVPEHLRSTEAEKGRKKIFRYSVDGKGFWGTEVPRTGKDIPPYAPFQLNQPAIPGMFVPEGWARDVLRAIMAGAVAVAEWGEGQLVGFSPKEKKDTSIINLGKH